MPTLDRAKVRKNITMDDGAAFAGTGKPMPLHESMSLDRSKDHFSPRQHALVADLPFAHFKRD